MRAMGLFERLREMRAELADMVVSDQASLPEHAPIVHRHEHNAMGPILDALELVRAARLRRNVIGDHPHINPERFADPRSWVTVPREDFDRLSAAQAALDRLDASQADTTGRVD